ncbi:ankyrin repeat domain-containing protein 46 [Lates japonicus]|uniref:Ankyrin repeat domain-containing protein 46 n=1 Tax=Lates japonicus TaxID=270547 RepID=A0AAD3RBT7_LATJO|nr:ankyrin repeat domain-containing protein 46 [Lates japonicus]
MRPTNYLWGAAPHAADFNRRRRRRAEAEAHNNNTATSVSSKNSEVCFFLLVWDILTGTLEFSDTHSDMSYVFINDSSQTNVPLLQACIDGDLPFAKRLLETGCDPNIRDNRGRTGLHLAAARGNVDICRLLHKFGADLLATDYQGNTALHLCGHVDTIQFLVSNGLKIDICNHNGSTPLVLAKRRGVNKDAIRLLEDWRSRR